MEIPLIGKIKSEIIDPLIWFVFFLGFLYFLYGVYEMVRNADDETARAAGRQHILYGVIGMFIMISFWGIMNLICGTIGADCG